MGDHSKAGINSSLAPGVKLGPYCIVGAGVHLQEDLEPGKMMSLDKENNIVKENTLTISREEKQKLTEVLKKYKQNSNSNL